MKKLLLIAGLFASLCGCATQEKFDLWVGHHTDELILKWGAPKDQTRLSTGSEVLTYNDRGCTITLLTKDNYIEKVNIPTEEGPCWESGHRLPSPK